MLSGDIERDQWHEMGSIAIFADQAFIAILENGNFPPWIICHKLCSSFYVNQFWHHG